MKLLIIVIAALTAYIITLRLVDRLAWRMGFPDRVHDVVVFCTSFSVLFLMFWIATAYVM